MQKTQIQVYTAFAWRYCFFSVKLNGKVFTFCHNTLTRNEKSNAKDK